MQDYQHFKNNPDPAIAKYNKKVAIAEGKEVEISTSKEPTELPEQNEIPEARENESIMEVL
jgi:hypothetical protein